MVTLNALDAHMPEPDVKNIPHQHAFVLVGNKTHFAVHMTQFHCELHKYQLIFKITLNGKDDELRKVQKKHPDAALFFCNGDNSNTEWFSIPSIGSGDMTELKGNIFLGLRLPPDAPGPDFFPWSLDRVKPIIPDVTVTVERVVLFRPYAHHEKHPDFATFFLWGEGDEAHITNKQIAEMSSSEFEQRAFGRGKLIPVDLNDQPVDPQLPLQHRVALCGGMVVVPGQGRQFHNLAHRHRAF